MNFWRQLPFPIIGLSPMDGVTDAAFRQLAATYGGPDIIFTEFTHVGDICQGRDMGFSPLQYSEKERPIVAQLYGKDPNMFYRAAQVVCELGFDGLDINMGCPSKNVTSSGSGAGLIRTPELALRIMASARQGILDWSAGQSLQEGGLKSAVRQHTTLLNSQRQPLRTQQPRYPIPLSVKTRLGYDTVIIDEWSDCLVQGQPEAISIHGRTLMQMYRGEADWDAIAQATQHIQPHGILALGNGDIRSLNEAAKRLRTSGVDGVLLGRAALGNPWIFKEKERIRQAVREGGSFPIQEPVASLEERFQMMMNHATLFESLNDAPRFPRMRKHLGWYCHGFSHAAAMRARMVRTTCSQDVQVALQEYWTQQGFSQPLALAG